MSYTIVGMFPNNEDLDTVAEQLESAGFPKEDYTISRYSSTRVDNGTSTNSEIKDDEKTTGFWNWLFGDDVDDKNKYSYAGTKSNIVTVYTEDINRAEKAREIMDAQGAINVNEFTKERFPENTTKNNDLLEAQYARIISKAKNNLYMTDGNRFYDSASEGMESDMDSEGSRNTF